MKALSLLLRGGPIEDAFVYRTQLVCWTYEHRVRVYEIADIERALEQSSPRSADLVNYALFHSGGRGSTYEQRGAWAAQGDLLESVDTTLAVEAEAVPYFEIDIGFEANALYDLHIYNDRLFLATDEGLSALDEFTVATSAVLRPRVRVKAPCYAANSGLGVIAASCGPLGLRLLLNEFGSQPGAMRTRRASEESVRAEVGHSTVVNHRTRGSAEFLAGRVEKTDGAYFLTEVRKTQVSGQGGDGVEAALAAADHAALAESIEFSFWNRSRLIVLGLGTIYSVAVKVDEFERKVGNTRHLGSYGPGLGRIVSASTAGRSIVLEGTKNLMVIHGREVVQVPTGPVVSMRTYQRSYRYQRLISAVSEGGLNLLAITSDREGDI